MGFPLLFILTLFTLNCLVEQLLFKSTFSLENSKNFTQNVGKAAKRIFVRSNTKNRSRLRRLGRLLKIGYI